MVTRRRHIDRDRSVSPSTRYRMYFLAVLAVTFLESANPAPAAPQSMLESGYTPVLIGRVNDTAKVLTLSERQRLSDLLATYERETHHQIVVLTVPNLSGESIEAYSLRVANSWGIGKKGFDDGILVTLSMAEHNVRIEPGKGMQRYISDANAKAINKEDMIPAFRNGGIAEGLDNGLRRPMAGARRYVINPND